MALDPKKTAVVFIEFQNEFATPGGKLHDAVKAVMESTDMLAKAQKVAAAARAAGALVLHAPITFADGFPELRGDSYGILANVKAGGCFLRSGWGGALCDAMTPAAGEVVIEGKRGLCGFASTNLDFVLRQNKVDNLVLCGFLTNCCVESTMRSGYEKGYSVFTLTDCCAATSQSEHDAAVNFTFPMFSTRLTAVEFMQRLGGTAA